MHDERLVVGMRIGEIVRAYPHQVLDWHEIVNDSFEGEHVAVTHCPLTGTGMAWDREINGQVTEFGVSGLLFRNNLLAYDRRTNSLWSQMQQRSVNGERIGTVAAHVHAIEMPWATWRKLFPDSEVLVPERMTARDYSGFAYGRSYLTDPNRILFPVRNPDARLPAKERVHGIIGPADQDDHALARVYVIGDFGQGVALVEDQFGGEEYLIVGSSEHNFATAFERVLSDGARPSFKAVQDALPVILEDGEGNRWDVFGVAVEGPRTGERLTPARSYTGYWFAWADFFPDARIHGADLNARVYR